MRFLELLVLGIFLISNLFGTGEFHVSQSFDSNSNGNSEVLVLNSKSASASLLEISASNEKFTAVRVYMAGENTLDHKA